MDDDADAIVNSISFDSSGDRRAESSRRIVRAPDDSFDQLRLYCSTGKMRHETTKIPADRRIVSPSAERNKGPIAEILMLVLPGQCEVLGGQQRHGAAHSTFRPGNAPDPLAADGARCRCAEVDRELVEAYTHAKRSTHRSPSMYATRSGRPQGGGRRLHQHASHSASVGSRGVSRGAGKVLPPGGILFLYGPYRRQGQHTSPGNQAFDEQLKAANPEWGVRNLEDVARLAKAVDLELEQIHDMPANNLSVVFRKR